MTMKLKWLSTTQSLPQKTEFSYYFEGSFNEKTPACVHCGCIFPFYYFLLICFEINLQLDEHGEN